MQYVLGNMLNGGGGLNADKLALDLQFAEDKTLTARKGPTPVFTRASSATFVGSNGLIQTAATNIPRFDHTSAGVCRGLLIEESRTNTALYSGALVINAGWISSGTTSVADGVGPDGNTAYEITETSGGSVIHTILNTGGTGSTQAASVTSGTTYTGSIFLKKVAGSVDWVQVTLGSVGFGTGQYANINLSNGTIGNSSGGTARVDTYANGWYRVSWSAAATATTTSTGTILVAGINNTNWTTRTPSYAGSTANKFLAAMAQFEAGSFATSYIPTTTGSVVRSADVCSITGADFNRFYNQTEGTIIAAASIDALAGNNRGIYGINNNTASHGFLTFYNTSSSGIISQSRNTASTTLSPTFTNSAGAKFTRALAYYLGGCSIATNGSSVTNTATTISTQTMLTLQIGNMLASSFYGTCHISSLRYYRKRLPDSKLQALTA